MGAGRRGNAFLFIIMGVFYMMLVFMGWLSPHLRNVEIDIPDVIADDDMAENSE